MRVHLLLNKHRRATRAKLRREAEGNNCGKSLFLLVFSVNKAITRSRRARQHVERARGIRAGSPGGDRTTRNLLENSQPNGAKSTEELGNAKTTNCNILKAALILRGDSSTINRCTNFSWKVAKLASRKLIEISVKLS